MVTRRQVLKGGIAVGAAAAIGGPYLLRSSRAQAAAIDPGSIPKYVTPLFIIPPMPPLSTGDGMDQFHVAERRIAQQMLPPGMPKTLVNGYGTPGNNGTFHSPGFAIENTVNRQTRVTWENQLVDSHGNFLPHLLTVDPTIHWANPPGGVDGRDSTPTFTSTPPPYTGPQPMVVHLHGTHDFEESDGLPETWFLPLAKNIPPGFATVGTDYDAFKQEAKDRWGVNWDPGTVTSVYPNDQRATMLMYHDHVLGMTRLDVYTGLVGLYYISGGDADLPAGTVPGPRPKLGDPPGTRYYDIAMILQDKSFNADGSLFFPDHSDQTVPPGDFIPNSDIPPYWNSSFQGTVSTVNGNTWPVLEVEPRRYRFRILDMDNFRVPQIKIVRDPIARPGQIAVPTWVIGADGGLLPQAQPLHETNTAILMVTTERVDLIVDFTGEAVGNELFMINDGVRGDSSTPLNDVNNIGQIMKFKVVPLQGEDTTLPPDQLPLPARRDLGNPTETHRVSMNVIESQFTPGQQKRFQMGRVDADGTNHLELWSDPISQVVTNGSTALWEVWNMPGVGGGHAFHIHLVEFQITERERLDSTGHPTGVKTPLSPWELGEKDTVFVPPQQITRFIAPFDHVSRFIYHCHFVDHEDHEMMRPFRVQ
ncbi:MAG: multicopper oxidase domain-containing protein [Actinobacteria bacterium]|nr:multicopper oxidase domain-containing protein [Actinomycetota bacterium]MBO0786980.1 multicopper oxidase domain-containing protein [Actinomycetota bacterium]